MTTNSAILFFAPLSKRNCALQHGAFAAHLEAHGFQVTRCKELSAMYQVLRTHTTAGSLAILDGSQSDNCAAASGLRALYPQLGIVVLATSNDEAEVIQALQSGADTWFSLRASFQLRMAMLFALLRGKQTCNKNGLSIAVADGAGKWTLREKGWVLANPQQVPVTLTTSERAFLLVLCQAPERHAARIQLLFAIDGCYTTGSQAANSRRLGVIVSRMRRKFQDRGLALPLQAVHGAGYMFTAELELSDLAE
ncbi:MAG TPA: winged helix-turn-helix domain-containing protein [Eoetvoesiella sp.]